MGQPSRLLLYAALPFALLAPLEAGIIDCIAVSMNRQVITLSQVLEDVRLTEFLNGRPLDLSAAERKRSEERLIEQALLHREMDLNHFPAAKPEEAGPSWKQLTAKFHSQADLQAALSAYSLSEDEVRGRLLDEVSTLRFVDYRFRSGIEIPDADIEAYYNKSVAEWKTKGVNPIPTLDESRAQIEEILQKERANQALDLWLADVRTGTDIVYHQECQ